MMAAPYNLTPLTNSTTIEQIIIVANDASNNILSGGVLISLFFVFFFSLATRFSVKKSLLASTFAASLLSVFMFQAGLINPLLMYFFIAAMAFSALWAYL